MTTREDDEKQGAVAAHHETDEGDHVGGMYRSWFLDYASYVILDRAVPNVEDGLKPVQRRILHALNELDDGRFNKAANVIGHTMRYHPHGDAAIADALVKMGQKDLLIETQGNWGNTLTGDSAAAPRYIEARLSEFAKAVLFNADTTVWVDSYDGRNKEPVALPVKFPLLLSHGVEGIAVGLATRILPHNFCELIKGSIQILQGKKPKLVPDFLSGGAADCSAYDDGKRGGKVKVRAVIDILDLKTLKISEIPFGTTTQSLIESILAANDKNKIKIKKVEDNTAEFVEILIHLPPGASPEKTIEALFAFTDCEISLSPNCCVIRDGRPHFCGITELLESSTEQTRELLKRELEIRKIELLEKLHMSELERIFIEERIYRKIETAENWEQVIATIRRGLGPFIKETYRPVSDDDIVKLTDIKIKRISKYDSERARDVMVKLRAELKQVEYDLVHLTEYAIDYFKGLLEKFGKGRERKTRLETFTTLQRQAVAMNNLRLYVNRADGFVGTSLRKDEFVAECSDLDEVIAFTRDGHFKVLKVSDKAFVGKDIVHIDLFRRKDDRCVYHLVYRDGKSGPVYAKRFNITGVTRDKLYPLTKADKDSKILYFSVNPNAEAETVQIHLKNAASKKPLVVDFAEIEIKDRKVVGSVVTKEPVKAVMQLAKGKSTLGAQKIWFDRAARSLNGDGKGEYLGEFKDDDKILVIYPTGAYELTDYGFNNLYSEDVLEIRKFFKNTILTAVYHDGTRKANFVKRFPVEVDASGRQQFVDYKPDVKILFVTTATSPKVKMTYKKTKNGPEEEIVDLAKVGEVKTARAMGTNLGPNPIRQIEKVLR